MARDTSTQFKASENDTAVTDELILRTFYIRIVDDMKLRERASKQGTSKGDLLREMMQQYFAE